MVACGNEGSSDTDGKTEEDTEDETVGEAATYGNNIFEITHQPFWVWQEVEGNYFMHSPKENEQDTFGEKVSLIIQGIGDAIMDAKAFGEASLEQIKGDTVMFASLEVLASDSVATAGKNGFQVTYTALFNGEKSYKWMQRFFVENEQSFILTYLALPTTYDKYLKDAETTMNSLVIKEPAPATEPVQDSTSNEE